MATTVPAMKASENPEVLEERIRQKAYELYSRRGDAGSELADWLQAEREVLMSQEQRDEE